MRLDDIVDVAALRGRVRIREARLVVADQLLAPLSDAIGVGATLVAAAALMTIGLAAALSVRDFRELRRVDDEPAAEAV